MIPNDSAVLTIESNIETTPENNRQMGIALDAMSAIMDSMINLYTRKWLAPLREYSTNALDANVEAGNTDPIRVTMPSIFDPTLVIADSGIGMSRDQVLNHYAQYGASSKRERNDQIGSFGFGCKSAFAVADQFTVVSVKDGRRVVVLFARTTSGGGDVTVLADIETDEPNGTKVSIPVRDDNGELSQSAREFFAAWEPGTVLLDGADPAMLHGRGYVNGPVIRLSSIESEEVFGDDFAEGQYVLMGSVLYKANLLGDRNHVPGGGTIIFRAGIGEVEIVPSREGVRESARTKDFIGRVYRTWQRNIVKQVRDEIAACTSAYEVIGVRDRSRESLAVVDPSGTKVAFTFDGQDVPGTLTLDVDVVSVLDYDSDVDRLVQKRSGKHRYTRSVDITPLHSKILVVDGIEFDQYPTIRRSVLSLVRQDEYARVLLVTEHRRADVSLSWLISGDPNTVHMDATTAIDAAVTARIAQRKLNPPKPRGPRKLAEYKCYTEGRAVWIKEDMLGIDDNGDEITVVMFENGLDSYAANVTRMAEQVGYPLRAIVLHGAQTENALRRRFEKLVPLSAAVEEALDVAMVRLGDPVALGQSERDYSVAKQFWTKLSTPVTKRLRERAHRLADPALVASLSVAAPDADLVKLADALAKTHGFANHPTFEAWNTARTEAQGGEIDDDTAAKTDLAARYVLIACGSYHTWGADRTDQIVTGLIAYANAVYLAETLGIDLDADADEEKVAKAINAA